MDTRDVLRLQANQRRERWSLIWSALALAALAAYALLRWQG